MPRSTKSSASTTRRVTRETPSIQSLDRGLLILEMVGKSRYPVSLAQLAEAFEIDRSSVFRLANTLKRRGFLANPSSGRDYILGTSIWRLSRQYDWSKMLATVAHDQLQLLSSYTNETVHLAIRQGRQALFIDHSATNHVIAISGQTGELVPLYCTSHGKALLADFDEAGLRNLFSDTKLKAYTKTTITSIAALAKACANIRTRGYATDNGEFLEGVRCLAAPIRDREGAVIASIGFSAPISRFPPERDKGCIERVTSVARQISEMVGAQNE